MYDTYNLNDLKQPKTCQKQPKSKSKQFDQTIWNQPTRHNPELSSKNYNSLKQPKEFAQPKPSELLE